MSSQRGRRSCCLFMSRYAQFSRMFTVGSAVFTAPVHLLLLSRMTYKGWVETSALYGTSAGRSRRRTPTRVASIAALHNRSSLGARPPWSCGTPATSWHIVGTVCRWGFAHGGQVRPANPYACCFHSNCPTISISDDRRYPSDQVENESCVNEFL